MVGEDAAVGTIRRTTAGVAHRVDGECLRCDGEATRVKYYGEAMGRGRVATTLGKIGSSTRAGTRLDSLDSLAPCRSGIAGRLLVKRLKIALWPGEVCDAELHRCPVRSHGLV